MLNNLNTEVTIGVLVDNRRSLNSGADAKWTSMNADEHADLRSVVEQIPLHGWHRWGDDRRSVSIVADRPLVQVWHLCNAGAVRRPSWTSEFHFTGKSILFFFIYKSVQRSSCMTKLFFIQITSLDHNRRFQDRHALQRKEELTLLYWRVLIYECSYYARLHISISARVDLGSGRVDDPAHLRLCPINRTHQIQPACSPSLWKT